MSLSKVIFKSFLVFLSLLILSIFSTGSISAQSDQSEATNSDIAVDLLEKELLLLIPVETDNPNLTLTFTNPTEEKAVQVKIDGQEYEDIQSPYILPSLSIGKHSLIFKFTDGEEVEQEVKKELIIVPRAPEINPPENLENQTLTFTGSAIAGGSVNLFLAGGNKTYSAEIVANGEGKWEYIFEEEFKSDVYTAVAFTKKSGFSSRYSEPLIFAIESGSSANSGEENDENGKDIMFAFSEINQNNILSTFKKNPDLAILVGAVFASGLLLSTIFGFFASLFGEKRSERKFRRQLSKKEKEARSAQNDEMAIQTGTKLNSSNSKPSLRGKFEAAGFNTDKYSVSMDKASSEVSSSVKSGDGEDKNIEIKSNMVEDERERGNRVEVIVDQPKEESRGIDLTPQKEPVKEEFTKEEFLSKFKDFDPDPNNKSKSVKEMIKNREQESIDIKKDNSENNKTEIKTVSKKSEVIESAKEKSIESEIKQEEKPVQEKKKGSKSVKAKAKSEEGSKNLKPSKATNESIKEEQKDVDDDGKNEEQKLAEAKAKRRAQLEKSIKITLTSGS